MERYIPTLAMEITNDTYPIAVAVLPGGFAVHPIPKMLGRYLVINELHIQQTENRGVIAYLGNAHCSREEFEANYTAFREERVGPFFKVIEKD